MSSFLPVAQFMPMFDPLGSVIGCMILIYLAATWVSGFVAIAAAFRAPRFGRAVGAAVFASALLLYLWFARGTIRSYRNPDSTFLIAAAAPALLGLIAWLIGAPRARRLELWSAPLIVLACVGLGVVLTRRDLDFRARRDAIVAAAKRGDASEVRKLLATGLSADTTDHSSNTLLELAPDAETTELLLTARATIGPRVLPWTAQEGNLPKMRVLLAHGADPNRPMGDRTAAQLAWWSKQEEALELLRQAGAREASGFQQATGALARAVEAGDAAAVKHRLASDYVDQERIEGLKVAAKRGDASVLAHLMGSTMAYREITDAALVAVEHDQVAAYKQLMDEVYRRKAGYILVETTDAALAIAAKRGNLEIARDAMARAEPGYPTPLDRARERRDVAVEKLLLAAEPSVAR
jgi:hypothetical protein